ncbi:MAG TPA: hypothetical protein VK947_01825 [Planococcus sp. (in: firmicutes)]|nr:hypothetical protein [Planococcus sp. (in: firmicutes)]
MAKRFMLAVVALIVLITMLFYGYRFFMSYESAPDKRSVEEVADFSDPTNFGDEQDLLNM